MQFKDGRNEKAKFAYLHYHPAYLEQPASCRHRLSCWGQRDRLASGVVRLFDERQQAGDGVVSGEHGIASRDVGTVFGQGQWRGEAA